MKHPSPLIRTLCIGLFLIGMSTHCLCWADTVLLSNGDKITGTVESMVDGKLKISTDYAGTITIDSSHVAHINTTQVHEVILQDGTEATSYISSDSEATLLVKDDDTTGVVESILIRDGINGIRSLNRPDPTWEGSLTIGGNLNSGNTNRQSLDTAIVLTRDFTHSKFESRYRGAYAEEEDEETARNHYLFGRYEHDISSRTYAFASQEWSKDRFKNTSLKSITSIGVGYRFLRKSDYELSTDIGVSYLSENKYEGEDVAETTTRLGTDAMWKITDRIGIKDSFYANRTNQDQQLLIRNELSLDTFIVQDWSFDITHIYERDSEASANVAKIDRRLIFGVKYAF